MSADDPLWLQLQNEQLHEAQVRTATGACIILGYGHVRHYFEGEATWCNCGQVRLDEDGLIITGEISPRQITVENVGDIPVRDDALTDADVRRAEGKPE